MITRRALFGRLAAAIGVAVAAPAAKIWVENVWEDIHGMRGCTLDGKELMWDKYCPPNTVYYLNPERMHVYKANVDFYRGVRG